MKGKTLFNLRSILAATAIAVFVLAFQSQSVSAAPTNEADGVLTFASHQLTKPFKLGADGLQKYDCSGLVYRAFVENDLAGRIGGDRRANGYYKWFKQHGEITSNPRRGDLVVWAKRGHRVSHVGIFYGYNRRGKPLALSALTTGVAIHKVHHLNKPFKAYLHVDLER